MLESLPRKLYRRLFKPAPWRIWTASRRVLPDFLVIGAMRAGTTTLHDLVCSHPQVAPALKKEVHFFDLYFARGLDWYRAHFQTYRARRRSGRITGEASPYYLFHPLVHLRAAEHLPQAKIIIILRNPVDRAYSHYWHIVRQKFETLSFEDALDREAERLLGEEQRLLAQPGYQSAAHQHFSYRSRSIYAGQVARWLDQFPRQRVLVLEAARFFGDLDAGAHALFDFLELDRHSVPVARIWNEAAYPPLAPGTRRKLLDFFAPHNERLFDVLGESFDWQD